MVIYASRETLILAGIVLMAGGIGTWRSSNDRMARPPRSTTFSLVLGEWAGILMAATGALLVAAAVFAWALP